MRLLVEQVSNIRLWPSPREDIGATIEGIRKRCTSCKGLVDMKFRRFLAVGSVFLSFSCLPTHALAKEKPAKVSYDPYTKTTSINGQAHSHNALLDLDKWDYWLSASITDGIAKNPVLMFSTFTPEWYFFDRAADVDGNELPVIRGGRDVQLGGVSETIGIVMTPKYLTDHRTTGFNLKIMGSRGARVVVVSPEVITTFEAAYLSEVEKVGGFRNDLVAAQTATAPTAQQVAQANMAGAETMAARGGFGISYAVIPQGIILMAVAPNSRADKGKLKPGQLVTALNGRNIAGLSQSEVQGLLTASAGVTTFTVAGLGDLTVAP